MTDETLGSGDATEKKKCFKYRRGPFVSKWFETNGLKCFCSIIILMGALQLIPGNKKLFKDKLDAVQWTRKTIFYLD